MMYAEASYFDGFHFQHIVAWQDHNRLERVRKELARIYHRSPLKNSLRD